MTKLLTGVYIRQAALERKMGVLTTAFALLFYARDLPGRRQWFRERALQR
jgi:hypothetical protein